MGFMVAQVVGCINPVASPVVVERGGMPWDLSSLLAWPAWFLLPRSQWLSWYLFCDAILGKDGYMSLQAVSVIFSMTFWITSPIVALHRSHQGGWKCFGGSAARCIISSNQLWSGQNGVIIIRSPFLLTILTRTSWMMFEGGKAYLCPFATSPSGHLLRCSPVWEIQAEVLRHPVCLSAFKQIHYWSMPASE